MVRNVIFPYIQIAIAVIALIIVISLHMVEEYPDDVQLAFQKLFFLSIFFINLFFGLSKWYYFSDVKEDGYEASIFYTVVQYLLAISIMGMTFGGNFRHIDPNNYPEYMSYNIFRFIINFAFSLAVIDTILISVSCVLFTLDCISQERNIRELQT